MSDRLDEIRARWAAATPGPWAARIAPDLTLWWVLAPDPDPRSEPGDEFVVTAEAKSADAAAIAAAPDDVAWLVAEVERLRNEGERDATTVELCMAETREAKAEVAHLRGLLDEPSEEEVSQLVVLAYNTERALHIRAGEVRTGRASPYLVKSMSSAIRAVLADLRERAGGD